MMSFYLSGGVEVLGFISPTEPTDEYPVIDPLYGIDGFRNVNTLSDLNSIPNLRRRAGMVVGVSGGTQYYKLNPSPWNGTITDWDTFSLGGGTFTGGTVTGDTIFTQGLTATTFSAATYLGLPLDVYVTGGTYSNGTITFTNNSGGTFNVFGLNTGTTINLSGGTGISVSGTSPNFIVENTLPDQIVNLSGGTNINVTGTYPNFGVEFTGTTSGSFTGGTVTGNTIFTQGVTATTFSASTYLGLPLDVYTTGFTFNSSTYVISIERNDGVTLTQNLSILSSDVTITGGTYNPLNGVATFTNNTGGTFNVSGFITGFTDIQVTGYTYQDNTFTISDSSGNTFSTTIDTMTGLTINGNLIVTGNTISNGLTATTISATTYQNLPLDIYVTGGTYSNGTITFVNNSGNTFNVNGLYTGQTSYVNSLTTGSGLSADTTTGDITIINTLPDLNVTISGGTGILTGGTYPNFTIENTLPDQIVSISGGTNLNIGGTYPNFNITLTGLTDNNRYTTGFTYQNNTFTIFDNSGSTYSATINSVTGLTVNGNLTITGCVVPNIQIISSSTSVTPTFGNDFVVITGLSVNTTINNPTGTWFEGKDLTIRIKDNGVARTIAWGTKYRAIGVTLPNVTIANKTTYVGLIYNSIDDKFDVIGSTTEL
jgi:hypothetical protein